MLISKPASVTEIVELARKQLTSNSIDRAKTGAMAVSEQCLPIAGADIKGVVGAVSLNEHIGVEYKSRLSRHWPAEASKLAMYRSNVAPRSPVRSKASR